MCSVTVCLREMYFFSSGFSVLMKVRSAFERPLLGKTGVHPPKQSSRNPTLMKHRFCAETVACHYRF